MTFTTEELAQIKETLGEKIMHLFREDKIMSEEKIDFIEIIKALNQIGYRVKTIEESTYKHVSETIEWGIRLLIEPK